MSDSSLAEIYFIVGVMIFILVLSSVATYLFFRTFYREKEDGLRTREDAKKTAEAESKIEK